MKKIVFAVITFCISNVAMADVAFITTKVTRTLVTSDSEFGGCLVKPTVAVSGRLNCPDTWITLDCAGALGGTKSAGQRMFEQVTLAVVLDKKVTLRVNDERKINGWCAADRVAGVP